MRAKQVLPWAVILAVGFGGAAGVWAQGAKAPALSRQEVQALQREGSAAANLESAFTSAVTAHAAAIEGRDQVALNQVFDARTRLMGVKNLKLSDPELDRALNDLLNLTTLAQRRLSSRSPAADDALQELVMRFSQTMATLPTLGGGGGGGAAAPILTQKLASELLADSYRALASAQVDLALGDRRQASARLNEAQAQLELARQAPGSDRAQDLIGALAPAIQLAQLQVEQNSPEALASTGKAVEQMATRIGTLR